MKTLIAILVGVGLLALCSTAFAAQVLPDEVLGELYAARRGTFDPDITDVDGIEDSAVAVQSNIGGAYNANGSGSAITQTNTATVINVIKGGEIEKGVNINSVEVDIECGL